MNICGVVDLLYPSKFNWLLMAPKSFPGDVVVKNPLVNAGYRHKKCGFNPSVGKNP